MAHLTPPGRQVALPRVPRQGTQAAVLLCAGYRFAMALDGVRRIDEVKPDGACVPLAALFAPHHARTPTAHVFVSLEVPGRAAPLVMSVDALDGFVGVGGDAVQPLPPTLLTRWPDLFAGVVRAPEPALVVRATVLTDRLLDVASRLGIDVETGASVERRDSVGRQNAAP